MSTVLSLAQHWATAPTPIAADGILDWIDAKNTQAISMLRAVAVTLGILFVIWQALASRGAMARVIVAGLAAGVFVWVVFNVTALRDRVDDEVNSQPQPPASALLLDAPHL